MPEVQYHLRYEFDRYYENNEHRSGAGICVIDWKPGETVHPVTWGGYLATPSGSPDNISVLTGMLVCQEPGVVKPGDVAHMAYLARISLDTPVPDNRARSYRVKEADMGSDSTPKRIVLEFSGSLSHGLIILES